MRFSNRFGLSRRNGTVLRIFYWIKYSNWSSGCRGWRTKGGGWKGGAEAQVRRYLWAVVSPDAPRETDPVLIDLSVWTRSQIAGCVWEFQRVNFICTNFRSGNVFRSFLGYFLYGKQNRSYCFLPYAFSVLAMIIIVSTIFSLRKWERQLGLCSNYVLLTLFTNKIKTNCSKLPTYWHYTVIKMSLVYEFGLWRGIF